MSVTVNEYGSLTCDHEGDERLCRREIRGGQTWYCVQCLTCGRETKRYRRDQVGAAMTEWRVAGPLPEWDQAAVDSWRRRVDSHYEQRRADYERQRQEESEEWWAAYNAHL